MIARNMGQHGQWYVASEDDTPRRIAGKLAARRAENLTMPRADTLSAEDIVALNRSRFPTLTVWSKLLANTQIFLGSGTHAGERVRDAGAHCPGEPGGAESLDAVESSSGKRKRESDLLATRSGPACADAAASAHGEGEVVPAEQAVSARHVSELSPEPEHINIEDFDYDEDEGGIHCRRPGSSLLHSIPWPATASHILPPILDVVSAPP